MKERYNPSIDANFSHEIHKGISDNLNKKSRTDYLNKIYTKHSLDTLYDNKFIDDSFDNYGDYYNSVGVTKEEVY